MRILLACEESQEVCKAFRERGHEAWSLDILPASGGHPEWHIQADVRPYLQQAWDMVLAFPPCTHLAASGARHFPAKRADGRQQEGVAFFMLFTRLEHVPRVVIENPVGIMSGLYRKPDQIIQPWQFGHDASKKTCLWLKGLPPLKPTCEIPPRIVVNGKPRWGNQTASGQNVLPPSPQRACLRSKTYPGIAAAMAAQWGGYYVH
jgi:hypothetical protein